MEATQSFEQWKEFLSQGIGLARSAGATQETIRDIATRIGGFLAREVDPANREQRLLKELWSKGTPQEQEALASMITKIVGDGQRAH